MKKLEAFSPFGLIVLATLRVAHNFLRFTNEETSFFTVHRRRCYFHSHFDTGWVLGAKKVAWVQIQKSGCMTRKLKELHNNYCE